MKEPQENSIREAWILCLILGLIMINFPFIHIFNTEQLIFNIPILVFYFLIGWPVSIGVIWFFVQRLDKDKELQDDTEEAEDKNDS